MKQIKLWKATLICLIPLTVSCSRPPSDEVVKTLIAEEAKNGLVMPEKNMTWRYVQVESVEIESIHEIAGDYTVSARVKGTCDKGPLLVLSPREPRILSCNSENVVFVISWKNSLGSWEANQEYALSAGTPGFRGGS